MNMTPEALPRTLRTTTTFKIGAVVALALFVAVLAILWSQQGLSVWTLVAAGLALFAIAGVADVFTARVTLTEDTLVVIRNLRRREYARDKATKVSAEKGCPISLQLDSREWIELPSVGPSRQGIVSTLRGWVRR